jgi:hypothetical protein
MRQQYLTHLIRMVSVSEQLEQLWTELVLSLQRLGYPILWMELQQQLSISRIAAPPDLSKARHHMRHGLGARQTSLISGFLEHQCTSISLRRSESNLTLILMWVSLLATAVQQINIEVRTISGRM